MPTKRGVAYYTKAVGMIEVSFPESRVFCMFCPLCYSAGLDRAKCSLTGEFIPYPHKMVGRDCILHIVEEERNGEKTCV